MKVLIFAGSLRKDSYNKKMARISRHFLLSLKDLEIEFVDLKDFPMPVYDADIEAEGIPDSVTQLGQKIAAADALVISTPEYNGSIPGILKNTIDWLSRLKPVPLTGKHLFLTAASPGALGGVRSLWHTRVPFEVLGVHVYPDMLGVPKAHEQVMSEEKLADAKQQALLEKFLTQYVEYVKKTLTTKS
jgi:NAD(P)H-dependent FMN reductase